MVNKTLKNCLGLLILVPLLVVGCGGSPEAKDGDIVIVHYTGSLDDGTVFDSSVDREPLEFTLGQGQMIPGFEQGVLGMKVGETRNIHIPADQAYGPHRDELVVEVDRSELPEDLDPVVGQYLEMTQTDGRTAVVPVVAVSETTITIDANHRLAGKDLNFEIELVEIK